MTAITQTVREIALEQPTSIRVFEHYGIDYCCGGRKPLAEACAASNLEVAGVVAALEAAMKGSVPPTKDWLHASLEELSGHILTTHHAYVKTELPRLAVLSQKVLQRHGDNHNHDPKPFIWHKTADQILDSLARFCTRTSDSGH